jgi:LysM repeat protein
MRRLIPLLLAFSLVLPVVVIRPDRNFAQVGEPWQLVAEVNALRAAYGLPPYEVNNALMSAAQKQSNYQAQVGNWTHTGEGGSRPHDRAVAAGYGGGAQVYISENVAAGVNLSPSKAVNEMWQDAIHLETMISPNFTHIGAGVGQAGDWAYYTIVVGYIAGSPGSGTGPGSGSQPSGGGGTPAPTAIPVEPISVATPGADGSIQHVVQWGQFLENIAKAYEVELSDMLALNGLSKETIIYPGDKLLIRAGQTLESPQELSALDTPQETEVISSTISVTATSRPPTRIPTKTPTPVPVAMSVANQSSPTSVAPTQIDESPHGDGDGSDYLLYAVFGFAITGTALILFGSTLKKRS